MVWETGQAGEQDGSVDSSSPMDSKLPITFPPDIWGQSESNWAWQENAGHPGKIVVFGVVVVFGVMAVFGRFGSNFSCSNQNQQL